MKRKRKEKSFKVEKKPMTKFCSNFPLDFWKETIKTRSIEKIVVLEENFKFFGFEESFLHIMMEINIETSNGKILNSHSIDIYSTRNKSFDTFFNNKSRRNNNLENTLLTFKTSDLELFHSFFKEKDRKKNWRFVDSKLALDYLDKKNKTKKDYKETVFELNQNYEKLKKKNKYLSDNLSLLSDKLSKSVVINEENMKFLKEKNNGFYGTITQTVNFILAFGISIIVFARKKMIHFTETYKYNKTYEICNKVIFIVSSKDKIGRKMSNESLKMEEVNHWEEMRKIDEKSLNFPSLKCNDNNSMQRLRNYTLQYCPTLNKLLKILIRDNGTESKEWKTTGIIHSILGSWNKGHRYFAKEFQKWTIPLGIPESMYILLNNLFSICYRKKIDPVIKEEVFEKRKKAKTIKKNEAFFTGEDNVSKSPAYGNFRRLFHFTTKVFYKIEIPESLQNMKKVYFKKKVKYRNLKIVSYANSMDFINSISKQGLIFCQNERKRLKERTENKENLFPPEVFVENLIPMSNGFTHDAMLECVKKTFSDYVFELEKQNGLITPKIACGDYQYYVQMCREYKMGNVIILAGHLHYRMSVCDCIWTIFRVFFLLQINIKFDYKCVNKFSSSKFHRYHLLIKHTFLAVDNILRKIENAPSSKKEIDSCENKILISLMFFHHLCGLYFALESFIRNGKWNQVSTLWDIFQVIFYYSKKHNYSLLNLSQRIRRKCLVQSLKFWLDSNRGICFNHKNARVDIDTIVEFTNDPIKKTLLKECDIESFAEMAALYGMLGMNSSREIIKWIRRKRQLLKNNNRKKRENVHEKSSIEVEKYVSSFIFKNCSISNFSKVKFKERTLFERKKMRKIHNPLYHYDFYSNPESGDYFDWQRKKIDSFNKNECVFEVHKKKKTKQNEEMEEDEYLPNSEKFDYAAYNKKCEEEEECVQEFEDDGEDNYDLEFELSESLK